MLRFYKLINNVKELRDLHESAAKEGALEVGVSTQGKLYRWDVEASQSFTQLSKEEAANRLRLTNEQIEQLIEMRGNVSFDDPVEFENDDRLEDIPIETVPEVQVESVLVHQEEPIVQSTDDPEDVVVEFSIIKKVMDEIVNFVQYLKNTYFNE